MADLPAVQGITLHEGDGTACVGDACLTLEGAYQEVKEAFLRHHPDGDLALLDNNPSARVLPPGGTLAPGVPIDGGQSARGIKIRPVTFRLTAPGVSRGNAGPRH